MEVIDIFTYNGEKDVLKLHLSVLDRYVDRFIIVEAKTTFSGQHKPLYFSEHEQYFKSFWKKIRYYVVNERYTLPEIEQAALSPNTQGAGHWVNEFLQKESILKALAYCNTQDEDQVYVGDVDEIWEPYAGPFPAKLKLRVYSYYLDNRSDEQFWGTYVSPYGSFKNAILNHERARMDIRTENYYGWHFTSMGGLDEVRRKLNDSYTAESYNTDEVQANLPMRHGAGLDYLGRPFLFSQDRSEWPKYLKANAHKFKRILTPSRDDPQTGSENLYSPKATNV